ncbi:Leucine-rich repeat protein [Handroanthus impetiginosus]|uniref:Leucine-rich repeat protein n=1 Tax=Handroanthus impetiginosus TaxID=429701 RepID=A0A2G9GYZ4_9LAMI|nr:Leucine-rich repeat protein [Handroanthus impetiginosus]
MKTLFCVSIFCITCILPAFSQCLDDQKSLLLGLRNSLRFDLSFSTKLVHWNHTKDCCNWDGVECDVFGHVISLQLDDETISGGIENSEYLFNLSYLEKLNLAFNSFDGIQIPKGLSNLGNLTHLDLSYAGFAGQVPHEVLRLKKLVSLDLSNNVLLSGTFPNFPENGSLRTIVLSNTNFSGPLPDSISNLTMLSTLDLSNCSFFGPIPPTIGNLTELTDLDISDNNFIGSIPSSAFTLPSLIRLQLSDNEFHGQVQELSNLSSSSSSLQELDISSNNLEGPVPKFFSKLEKLRRLVLSSNKFNGTVQLEMIKNPDLEVLDLSRNDLFVQSTDSDSSLPPLMELGLASCKLQGFPNLRRQSRLWDLDLSSNQLTGEIPNWIWKIGNGSIRNLNLSNNLLHGFQKPYKFPSLQYLDLHSNQFHGELPIPPMFSSFVDYSHNFFTNSIPKDISIFLSHAFFFSISNNSLTGEIPPSICGATDLEVLDLSDNALTGGIPPCLLNNISRLGVLNLGRNNLSGTIPDTFSVNCSLRALDLNKNALKGKIPRSIVNCPGLEVLNIGNNRIEDTFPCMMMKASLRVLILRSNKFYGGLQCLKAIQEWLNLQIIDISTNNFSGGISFLSFSKWWGMTSADDNKQSKYNNLHYVYINQRPCKYGYICRGSSNLDLSSMVEIYYQETVKITMKGLERQLTRILLIFTSIDFSNNRFHGGIPYSIGDLKSLHGLNLSHNELTGPIPASIGNLRQLDFLDLSVNKLNGTIPVELATLDFIGFLNLSYNRLFGKIPESPHFGTFPAASFEGNLGLYGCPVDTSCFMNGSGVSPPGFQNGEVRLKKEIDWDYLSAALGFAVGFGSTVWLTLHCKRWREMFLGKVDQIYLKFFPRW